MSSGYEASRVTLSRRSMIQRVSFKAELMLAELSRLARTAASI